MLSIHSLLIITISGFHAVLAGDDVSSDFDMQLRILSARLNESKITKATRIIHNIPKVEQPHFVEQILKLSQKSPEGSMGLEALDILSKIHASEREDAVNQYLRLMNADATASRPFAKSFQIISRIPTDHRSLFVDQVFRLIRPTMTLAQQVGIISALNEVRPTEHDAFIVQTLRLITPDDTNHENVLKVAQALSRLNADVRSQFVDFVFHNGVISIDRILELIQTSIEDWVDTLQGFRNILEDMQDNHGNRHILGLHNQTVHDAAYEGSLTESITKLSSRYSTAVADLEATLNLYLNKIDDLLSKKLMSETEAQIVRHFFSAGMERLTSNRYRVTQYLHLAWQALTDKAIAKDLGLEADFNDKDIDDRISGWLKAGPMDAQLAYFR